MGVRAASRMKTSLLTRCSSCRHEATQYTEFEFAWWLSGSEAFEHREGPAGSHARLLQRDTGMQADERQLAGLIVRFEHTEIRDHHTWSCAAQSQPLAITPSMAEPYRSHKVDALNKGPWRLPHDDDNLLG